MSRQHCKQCTFFKSSCLKPPCLECFDSEDHPNYRREITQQAARDLLAACEAMLVAFAPVVEDCERCPKVDACDNAGLCDHVRACDITGKAIANAKGADDA